MKQSRCCVCVFVVLFVFCCSRRTMNATNFRGMRQADVAFMTGFFRFSLTGTKKGRNCLQDKILVGTKLMPKRFDTLKHSQTSPKGQTGSLTTTLWSEVFVPSKKTLWVVPGLEYHNIGGGCRGGSRTKKGATCQCLVAETWRIGKGPSASLKSLISSPPLKPCHEASPQIAAGRESSPRGLVNTKIHRTLGVLF